MRIPHKSELSFVPLMAMEIPKDLSGMKPGSRNHQRTVSNFRKSARQLGLDVYQDNGVLYLFTPITYVQRSYTNASSSPRCKAFWRQKGSYA